MLQSVHLELYSAPCVAANAVKATLVCSHRSLALYVSQCDALNEITNSYITDTFCQYKVTSRQVLFVQLCSLSMRLLCPVASASPRLWPWVEETCRSALWKAPLYLRRLPGNN